MMRPATYEPAGVEYNTNADPGVASVPARPRFRAEKLAENSIFHEWVRDNLCDPDRVDSNDGWRRARYRYAITAGRTRGRGDGRLGIPEIAAWPDKCGCECHGDSE